MSQTFQTYTERLKSSFHWAKSFGRANKMISALVLALVAAGVFTFAILTAALPFKSNPTNLVLILTIDLVLLLILGGMIARHVWGVWLERKRGHAGSQLHVKLLAVFSFVTIIPAILLAVFATIFFYVGMQSWLDDKVRTAVYESSAVVQAYLEENQQLIRLDAQAMADYINNNAFRLTQEGELENFIIDQSHARGLSEVIVFNADGKILARSGFSYVLELHPVLQEELDRANKGEIVLRPDYKENLGETLKENRMRALVRLDRLGDTYLFVSKWINSNVLQHVDHAHGAIEQYQELEKVRVSLQVTITLIYVSVALLLLMLVTWFGVNFANYLATPISALIAAAEQVRGGDLSIRVPEGDKTDELNILSRAFNRMTSQLERQRQEILDAQHHSDLRRVFIETVLSGVSAGVIGLSPEGKINLINQSAIGLLDEKGVSYEGLPLINAIPEIGELLYLAQNAPEKLIEGQILLERKGHQRKTLFVRIVAELIGGKIQGFVVTFDDITELLSAQKNAAWSDVARRIAHEIKNPLTPILLSAERLQRKYKDEIQSSPDTFQKCINTITRNVQDIGRMVNEFSSFARMPTPVIAAHDLVDICQQAVFSYKHIDPKIRIGFLCDLKELSFMCDQNQLHQVLTNLIQNAIDSIQQRFQTNSDLEGLIEVTLEDRSHEIVLCVRDNGIGLPSENREELTDPYVTKREKGTGLGLAIVKKIIEDHKGKLILADLDPTAPEKGALIQLIFSK